MSWQRGWGEAPRGSGAAFAPDHARGGPALVTEIEARRRAGVMYWRGFIEGFGLVVAAGLGIGFGVSMAMSETISIGRTFINGSQAGGTTVSIAPSDRPGELAVITLENRHVNDGGDTAVYPLAMGDVVAVLVEFTWDADPVLGSDRITVTPPQGVTCEPADCTATVLEGLSGQVVLIDWRGM